MNEQQEREILEWMRTQAKMTRSFYEALVEQHFTPPQALDLTRTWLASFNSKPPEIKP